MKEINGTAEIDRTAKGSRNGRKRYSYNLNMQGSGKTEREKKNSITSG
jgi:hypothetical protein